MLGKIMGLDYPNQSGKLYGLVVAIVTAVKDTKQNRHTMGCVQVYFPWLQDKSDPALINPWARLVRVEAGTKDDAGMCVFPQIDDEVICGFEHGDIHRPYVIGSVWNGKDKCPNPDAPDKGGEPAPQTREKGAQAGGDNKTWLMRSRYGHKVFFDDKNKHITIESGSGKARIELEDNGPAINIVETTGKINIWAKSDINVTSKATINVKADKDINMQAGNNINIKAGKAIDVQAGTTITEKAGTSVSWTAGTSYSITAGTSYSLTAGSSISLTAGSSFGITCGSSMNVMVGASLTEMIASNVTSMIGGNVTEMIGGNVMSMVGGNVMELIGGNVMVLIGGNCMELIGGNDMDLEGGCDFEISGGCKGEIFGGLKMDIFGGIGIDIFGGLKLEISGGIMIDISAALKIDISCLNLEMHAGHLSLGPMEIDVGGITVEASGASVHGVHPSGGPAPVGM